MKKIFVLSYKQGSKSARELSKKLGVKRIKRVNSKWKPSPDKIVINWGTSVANLPAHCYGSIFINKPEAVSLAANKLEALRILYQEGVNMIPWTTSVDVANAWLRQGNIVYCRTKLSGHSGAGIVVVEEPDGLVRAPLYTRGVKDAVEFRIHVAFGKVIDMRRKAKRKGVEGNPFIKNHANGYVYRMKDIIVPREVCDTAIEAVEVLSLDFGAVDILWDGEQEYVLEVNTACGLAGTTVENYAKAFEEELGDD